MRWLLVVLGCLLSVVGCSIHPVDQTSVDMIEIEEYEGAVGGSGGLSPSLYSTDGWQLWHYYEHGLAPRSIPLYGSVGADRPIQQAPPTTTSQTSAATFQRAAARSAAQPAHDREIARQQNRRRQLRMSEPGSPVTDRNAYMNKARQTRQSVSDPDPDEEAKEKEARQRRRQRIEDRF